MKNVFAALVAVAILASAGFASANAPVVAKEPTQIEKDCKKEHAADEKAFEACVKAKSEAEASKPVAQ